MYTLSYFLLALFSLYISGFAFSAGTLLSCGIWTARLYRLC